MKNHMLEVNKRLMFIFLAAYFGWASVANADDESEKTTPIQKIFKELHELPPCPEGVICRVIIAPSQLTGGMGSGGKGMEGIRFRDGQRLDLESRSLNKEQAK